MWPTRLVKHTPVLRHDKPIDWRNELRFLNICICKNKQQLESGVSGRKYLNWRKHYGARNHKHDKYAASAIRVGSLQSIIIILGCLQWGWEGVLLWEHTDDSDHHLCAPPSRVRINTVFLFLPLWKYNCLIPTPWLCLKPIQYSRAIHKTPTSINIICTSNHDNPHKGLCCMLTVGAGFNTLYNALTIVLSDA